MAEPLTILSEEEELLYESVLAFARERIQPLSHDMDEQEKMDPALVESFFENDYMGIEIPEELGGLEADFFSSILVHFLIAAHPIHILFHMQHQALTAATSHTGFEGLLVKDRNRLALGTFHHQMHHRYFECNYGTAEMPWDRWFGSFHDGSAESKQRLRTRLAKRQVRTTKR